MDDPNSLVLTEDDHLDFLVNVSRDPALIPGCLQQAFTATSLLFLGYRLSDLDFRVLLRSLAGYLRKNVYFSSKAHFSVQLLAVGEEVSDEKQASIEQYLSKYCGQLAITMCVMTCHEFLSELQERWAQFNNTGGVNGPS